MTIDLSLCSSLPDKDAARRLLIEATQQQKENLLALLEQCQAKLRYDLGVVVAFFQNIEVNRKLSPAFFYYIKELSEKMRRGKVTEIMDALQKVNWLRSYGIYADELKVSSVLSEYWEVPYIDDMRSYGQKNICGDSTIVRPISEAQLKFHSENIREALLMIHSSDEDISSEIDILVSSIKLFQGRVLRGQASGDTLGAVWLRIPNKYDDQIGYWIEHIVHEMSHLRLHTMFYQERFVLNSDMDCKFKAPIRDDLRPMLGVYHATFVLARMVRIFKKLSYNGLASRFRDRLQLCQLQFDIGMNTVNSEEAEFTENGKLIRESFKPCALITAN